MTHQNDWIESYRRYWYPKLHKALEPFGLYATAKTKPREYVCTFFIEEESLEEIFLHDLNFERNWLAAYKTHEDGRESTLSLRLTHDLSEEKYDYPYVEDGMQLHLTFFDASDQRSDGALDCYAHYEDDYMANWYGHLLAKNWSAAEGVNRARGLFKNSSYLAYGQDYKVYKND